MTAVLALLVPLLAAFVAGSGTAWANVPKHRFVFEVTGTIPVTSPAAIAVNPATNTVYVVGSRGTTVSVISGATNTVTAVIPVPSPYRGGAVAVDPVTNMVYLTGGGNVVLVISGATNTVTRVILLWGLAGDVTDIAVNPATDTIYVSSSSPISGAVSKINGATSSWTGTIPMPAGTEATGLAADPGTNTIAVATQYVGGGGLLLINGASNLVTLVSLIEPQYAVAIDTSTGIYYSEGLGDLNAVNAHTYGGTGVANFPCPVGPCGGSVNELAVDSAVPNIYASFNQNGSDVVLVYYGTTGGLFATVPVPGAGRLAANPTTHTAYVSSTAYNTVTVISRVWV